MTADEWNGKLIRIQWDRICRSPECVTVDGKPIHASHVKLEWGGPLGPDAGVPTLTVTQAVHTAPGASSVIQTEGVFVPLDLWCEYQDWKRDRERGAS